MIHCRTELYRDGGPGPGRIWHSSAPPKQILQKYSDDGIRILLWFYLLFNHAWNWKSGSNIVFKALKCSRAIAICPLRFPSTICSSGLFIKVLSCNSILLLMSSSIRVSVPSVIRHWVSYWGSISPKRLIAKVKFQVLYIEDIHTIFFPGAAQRPSILVLSQQNWYNLLNFASGYAHLQRRAHVPEIISQQYFHKFQYHTPIYHPLYPKGFVHSSNNGKRKICRGKLRDSHVSTGQRVCIVLEGSPLRIDPPTPGIIPELLPR